MFMEMLAKYIVCYRLNDAETYRIDFCCCYRNTGKVLACYTIVHKEVV